MVQDDEVLPALGPGRGKGEAMWKSLAAVRGDVVVWLDADVVEFDPAFVTGLLGPLIEDPEVGYVKAVYRRALGADDDGGGRVTEICARPADQPLLPRARRLRAAALRARPPGGATCCRRCPSSAATRSSSAC